MEERLIILTKLFEYLMIFLFDFKFIEMLPGLEMVDKMSFGFERFRTFSMWTIVRSFISMHSHMSFQIARFRELFAADLAFVRLLASMCSHMNF
jgi:hypothetical protein